MAQDNPTQAIWRAYYAQHPELAPGSPGYTPPDTSVPPTPIAVAPVPAAAPSWFSGSTTVLGFRVPNVLIIAALGIGGMKLLHRS